MLQKLYKAKKWYVSLSHLVNEIRTYWDADVSKKIMAQKMVEKKCKNLLINARAASRERWRSATMMSRQEKATAMTHKKVLVVREAENEKDNSLDDE